jgi:hypothetical protein
MTKEKGKIDQLIRLNAEATTGVRLMQRRSLPGEAEITLPPRRLGSNAAGVKPIGSLRGHEQEWIDCLAGRRQHESRKTAWRGGNRN